MARREQSRGKCVFCGREMTRGGMSTHLSACEAREGAVQEAGQGRGKEQQLVHLQARDAGTGSYWLHLEMAGSATLADLDDYLRWIWLECCGHMSRFSVGGWGGNEIPMSRRIDRVFQPGVELTHIYDFGTESVTLIKAVGVRTGKPLTTYPIKLMARNDPPQAKCIECDKPAAWLCVECLYEHEIWGTLCDEHAEEHPHDDYGDPLPLVNSPRIGLCGYDGPAVPPY